MTDALAVSDVVNVTVSLSPIAAAVRNFGSLLIVGSSNVIDVSERIRRYADLTAVAADFGTSAAEYLAARNFFAQSPKPALCYIGRWAYAATSGLMHGGIMTAAQQLPSAWTGITTGAFKITIDGTLRTLSACDFSAVGNMNAVAAVVNAKIAAWATCTWNSVYQRLEVVSNSTGTTSTISYATSPSAGVDISASLKLTAASSALPPVDGIAAETLLAAVTTLAGNSNQWYGLMVASTSAITADFLAVAAFIEAVTPSRIYGVTTQDSASLSGSSTSDLAYQLKALAYNRTFDQYSSTDPYAAASMFGRAFTVDFLANNTTITLKFKTEPGIVAESINETQAAVLKAKHCNVFVNYDNSTAIIQEGVMCSGVFFDEIHGTDWLQNAMQTAVYNRLYTSITKIPQTDAGTADLATAIAQACEQGVNNGLLAPGTWTGPAIGAIKSGQTLAQGYYVYTPPVSTQDAAAREARIAPTFQVAAKGAGAIHYANVIINFNR